MAMEMRTPVAFFFMMLLLVPMCTALRFPASFGKFGRVPAVVRGDNELTAVLNLQYHAQEQHLRPLRESGAADGSDHDECQELNGFQLTHCQRLRFERLLAEDYQDAHANVNVVYAPLPA
ncbi:hypothetical protein MPTK1_4g09410 [Marchantia polymorpha subsp. ruderalis]|uniref:Phytosulfokine-beta n=2 Tax=Marchantia polymorpha TaxID=3197 RepID=A0A176VWS0_MARPO|nr:hypothetical protein AXG93_4242s1250 [Marchantia polymorpha subsp. ruderalis]PTQ31393.1 hypothetical protein MARPO_0112s0041 [Marchantia polymorpha]BBN08168.1 hypothetical protein Mp_4g09410 [Marchantia polymorpha subsp. ruderalis]|eukprot:PTQ31393.1 hypothetical protein MARPO_0112s0041 [Marchantia polymorpha]